MHLATANGVHLCILGDRAIFLDVGRDRYFAASADATQALIRACEVGAANGIEPALEPLIEVGLLARTPDRSRSIVPTARSPARKDWQDLPKPKIVHVLIASWFQLVATLAARRGFADLIAKRRKRRPNPFWRPGARRIVSAHRATNLLVSAHDRCLIKSIALLDMLRCAGHDATLVIGVQNSPFGAHAWVELDDAVVSDSVEVVSLYMPVMVV
jgi:hypothetical protein